MLELLLFGKSEAELKKDFDRLLSKWSDIVNTEFSNEEIPKLIYKTNDLLCKLLTDLVDYDLKKITVNSKKVYETVKTTLEYLEVKDIELEYKKEDLMYIHDLARQNEEAEDRKIWLKCGGFITIDKTEALTAIDVNSGKYVGNENLEDTIFTVNKEASLEIAKQLRLRDIGGIVIVDFIDMHEDKNKEEMIKIMTDAVKEDRSKIQVEGFTKLNLLEITRKHICSN